MGHWLTIWSIRLALAFFAGTLAISLARGCSRNRSDLERMMWTIALGCFVVHLIAAFHFYHHWSHREALADTARQTKELMGWEFGQGIYFSYLFGIIWAADVAASWWIPDAYAMRPAWLRTVVVSYLVFIAFNGAAIFEAGPTRYYGVPVTIGLGGWLLMRWIRSRLPVQRPCLPK